MHPSVGRLRRSRSRREAVCGGPWSPRREQPPLRRARTPSACSLLSPPTNRPVVRSGRPLPTNTPCSPMGANVRSPASFRNRSSDFSGFRGFGVSSSSSSLWPSPSTSAAAVCTRSALVLSGTVRLFFELPEGRACAKAPQGRSRAFRLDDHELRWIEPSERDRTARGRAVPEFQERDLAQACWAQALVSWRRLAS